MLGRLDGLGYLWRDLLVKLKRNLDFILRVIGIYSWILNSRVIGKICVNRMVLVVLGKKVLVVMILIYKKWYFSL